MLYPKNSVIMPHAHLFTLNNFGISAVKVIFLTLFLHNELNQKKNTCLSALDLSKDILSRELINSGIPREEIVRTPADANKTLSIDKFWKFKFSHHK